MKTLLLDIDYTLFCEAIPRPYLKEFLERMSAKYNLRFYTAGNMMRVTDVCRVMLHQLGMDKNFVRQMQRTALSRENCPTRDYQKPGGGVIEIKCLRKAADMIKVPITDLIMLDDNPSYDHPHSEFIVQADGFMGDMNDTYLKTLEL